MLKEGLMARVLRALVAWTRQKLDELEKNLPPAPEAGAKCLSDAALSDAEAQAAAQAQGVDVTSEPTPATAEVPEADPAPEGAAQEVSSLDFPQLKARLFATDDPVAELKVFTRDIRTREHEAGPKPSDAELFAARLLTEAGLFSSKALRAKVVAVPVGAGDNVYFRCLDEHISYYEKIVLISLEEALFAASLVWQREQEDGTRLTAHECMALRHAARESITRQAGPLDEGLPLLEGELPDGEWAVRRSIATGIEELSLPYRLKVRYRTNVADGNVAFSFEAIPQQALPNTMPVEGVGDVASTRDMREEAASRYTLRLALVLASLAFRASTQVKHAWIHVALPTPVRTWCQLCVDFDRWRFAKLDLTRPLDLAETYRSFAANIRLEEGRLRPVEQTFDIDEPRFCPLKRNEFVSLSSRRLKEPYASALGTDHVSGLSVRESEYRALVAANILVNLTGPDEDKATEKNVRAILDMAADDPDPTVRDAAERTVRHLVSGEIDGSPAAFLEEFTHGDALSRAVEAARKAINDKDFQAARDAVTPVLESIDAQGLYDDTAGIEWRSFNSFVERTVYNRLNDESDKTVMLVPDAYYEAHLADSAASLMLGDVDRALAHARRLAQLAPLDGGIQMHLSKCLERAGKSDEAVEGLRQFLTVSYDPTSAGLAYYRLAYFMWHAGSLLAAQACYACALHFLPQFFPQVSMELSVLSMQHPETLHADLTPEKCIQILEDYDIPVVPSPEIAQFFVEGMRASVDAEIFPVARNFREALGVYQHDSVTEKVLHSLEGTQDQRENTREDGSVDES